MQRRRCRAPSSRTCRSRYDNAMSLFDELVHPPQPRRATETPVEDASPLRGEQARGAGAGHRSVPPRAFRRKARRPPADAGRGAPALRRPTVEATIAPHAATAAADRDLRARARRRARQARRPGRRGLDRALEGRERDQRRSRGGDRSDGEHLAPARAAARGRDPGRNADPDAVGRSSTRHPREFDPLEFDRYTRLQELTRMLAESVEDVATVQSNMLKGLQMADTDLTAQIAPDARTAAAADARAPGAVLEHRRAPVPGRAPDRPRNSTSASTSRSAAAPSRSTAACSSDERPVRAPGAQLHRPRPRAAGRARALPARPRPARSRSKCGRRATRSSPSSATTVPA